MTYDSKKFANCTCWQGIRIECKSVPADCSFFLLFRPSIHRKTSRSDEKDMKMGIEVISLQ